MNHSNHSPSTKKQSSYKSQAHHISPELSGLQQIKRLPARFVRWLKFFLYLVKNLSNLSYLVQRAVTIWQTKGLRGVVFSIWQYARVRRQLFAIRLPNDKDKSFVRLQFEHALLNLPPVRAGVIFLSHNASATGAPINLLNQCNAYKQVYGNQLVIILMSSGELARDFENVAPTIDLQREAANIQIDADVEYLFSELCELGYTRCVANTVVSGALTPVLMQNQIETVYEIHELPQLILGSGWGNYARNIAQSGALVIFAAKYVAEKFVQNFGLPTEFVRIAPQGVRPSMIYPKEKTLARKKVLSGLGLPVTSNIKIILGAGIAHLPKGTDLFLEVARELYELGKITDTHFIWLGNCDDYFENWKKRTLPHLPYKNHVHFWKYEAEPAYIFASADLFLLTSREDSFPSVALEAMANNVPVITFKDTGGIEEIINDTNGVVVSHLNVNEMAQAAINFLESPLPAQPLPPNWGSYTDFIQKIIPLFSEKQQEFRKRHKVTVVIPNYNYANYLSQRLTSILNQTYPPSEIIFLDDASTDNSVEIAKQILEASSIPYKIIVNEQNQGIFRQWLKGIREASHEYLWIAEADDFADVGFLAQLMPAFANEDVNLAYCQLAWVDENSQPYPNYNYQDYVRDLSPTRWQSNYLENGQYEVNNYLGIRNTIPNVSGVVFRKQALQRLDEKLLNFRYAGDWYVYLQTLQQGKIYYAADVLNFHRRHRRSTIADANGNAPFFEEVRKIYQHIADNFPVNFNTIDKMERNLSSEKNADQVSELNRVFFETFRQKALDSIKSRRRLKILIILSEFKIGGGEITGLRLANYLARTHDVYLYAAKKESSPSFLAMISPDVQVIEDESALYHLVHSENLDFVNSHIWWGDKLTYSFLKDNSLYWILSMHGCYEMLVENPQVDPDFQHLYEPIIQRANHITYDTKRNLRILDYLHNPVVFSKTRQIYHGYERKPPQQIITRKTLGLASDAFVFVFAGRGIREKGWEEAIQSAIALHENGLNLVLLMFGDSDYVQGLKNRYQKSNIIKFMGETANLSGYLAIADCGILPTYFFSESQPLTVIEFLAAGLPVISTDIGEIKSMLEMDGTSAGIVLPLTNGKLSEVLLRDAMRDLLFDKQKWQALKDAAMPIFNTKFDITKFAHAYVSLYTRQEQTSKPMKVEK